MKTICVLLPCHWGYAKGGAEYQAHLLSECLAKNSNYRVVYLARDIPLETSTYNYAIRGFKGLELPGGLRWGRSVDAFALYSALRSIAPDVIIHMVASAYTGIATFYANRNNCQMYWYLASDKDVERFPVVGAGGPARVIDTVLFFYGAYRAKFIIAQTKNQTEKMQETLNRKADLVLANFVPGPVGVITKSAGFVVYWIANLKQLKRPELFIDLVAKFPPDSGIEFRMAGSIAEQKTRSFITNAEKAYSNFKYLGELALHEVEAELEKAHIFVNTSDYEGVPNVFVQAWYREVPVFSIHVDPDDVMAREQIGRKTGSFEGLVEAVREAAQHPEQIRAMGARARRFATRTHGMENVEDLIAFMESNFSTS